MKDLQLAWGFVPGESVIHRLDPRLKGGCLLGLVLAGAMSLWGGILCWMVAAYAVAAAGLSWRRCFRLLYPLRWLFLFTFGFHLLSPGPRIVSWLPVSYSGLWRGGVLCLTLALFVVLVAVFNFTTSPLRLAQAADVALRPFNRLGLHSAEVALMLMVAMQAVPLLFREARRLTLAQMARGIDPRRGGPWRRIRNMLALFIPLINSIQQRAEHLALSLTARGYTAEVKRSYLYPLQVGRLEGAASVLVAGVLALAWWSRRWGYGFWF